MIAQVISMLAMTHAMTHTQTLVLGALRVRVPARRFSQLLLDPFLKVSLPRNRPCRLPGLPPPIGLPLRVAAICRDESEGPTGGGGAAGGGGRKINQ